ncbi:FAD-dependent oxidoreductase [Promicromonospora sukumoe]|uniref:2-polyprenyl-6-methoxyphenol hydroxylase-like FAD-dependent oxidoreductase n=1 Tax=Promicromonospora sukumoe TaxID=88382 RepID=A0A7W3PFD6_9MICO|nr:FAD-dependent monooxygenase [Promicromonospora sukumoe]MBA8809517.1 2-polyprenyl-6-methoxyphenol hydroxylase-like FAD-dependent oxidoreductase [Promicromonospora sukumoe]
MRAIIVGAGITGPVTAMALQKAGIEATVHEAYDRTADGVGAYLTLAPNGLAALQVLDIDHHDLGGFDTPALELRGSGGRVLARLGMGRDDDAGTVSQTVRRSDLYTRLRDEAVRRGISVEYGKRLVDATVVPGAGSRAAGAAGVVGPPGAGAAGVVASFADGTTAEGDLLIGADGLHSRTRAILDPACPPPRYTGLLNTGGYASGVTVDGPRGVFTMTFGKRAFFAYANRGPGDVWWFANVPRAREASADELAAWTPERWRAELERLFADDAGPALELIAATPQVIGPWNTLDLPRVPVWHRGPIGLVGDAAHGISPTSGQGASLAIEDGVLLARFLRDHRDPAEAFAAFEELRRGRVERLIAQAKRTSNQKIPNPLTRVLRDRVILPLVSRAAARSTRDWVTDYRIDWNTPTTPTPTPR